MSRVLAKYVTTGGVTYPPGPVPDDVAAQITAAGVWADDKAADAKEAEPKSEPAPVPEPTKEAEPGGYDSLKAPELKAEIKARNEGRDEADRIKPAGAKNADLIAALEADDEAASGQ